MAVTESYAQAPDSDVVDLAVSDARVLLTEDKDFGQLAFAHGVPTFGVVLLRYPAGVRGEIVKDVVDLVSTHEHRLISAFIVVTPRSGSLSTDARMMPRR